MTTHLLTDARFVIRTTTGNRGPFSRHEISQLVHVGRLEPSVTIWDTTTESSVQVAELLGLSITPLPPPSVLAPNSSLEIKIEPDPTPPHVVIIQARKSPARANARRQPRRQGDTRKADMAQPTESRAWLLVLAAAVVASAAGAFFAFT